MTTQQKLGFEIVQTLMDEHNQKLREKGEKFFNEFDEVFKILVKQNYKAINFETLLYDYLGEIKREYYIAGSKIDDIVQNMEIEEVVKELRF